MRSRTVGAASSRLTGTAYAGCSPATPVRAASVSSTDGLGTRLAMTLPNVLSRVSEGAVVVTPADRADILLGLLLAHHSRTFPALAGIVLNGGFDVDPRVTTLVDGLRLSLPVVETPLGTADTAIKLNRVVGRITRGSVRKLSLIHI